VGRENAKLRSREGRRGLHIGEELLDEVRPREAANALCSVLGWVGSGVLGKGVVCVKKPFPTWLAVVLVMLTLAFFWVLLNIQYGGQVIRIPL
jgi:lipid-binding SYLF domain-containing protein